MPFLHSLPISLFYLRGSSSSSCLELEVPRNFLGTSLCMISSVFSNLPSSLASYPLHWLLTFIWVGSVLNLLKSLSETSKSFSYLSWPMSPLLLFLFFFAKIFERVIKLALAAYTSSFLFINWFTFSYHFLKISLLMISSQTSNKSSVFSYLTWATFIMLICFECRWLFWKSSSQICLSSQTVAS